MTEYPCFACKYQHSHVEDDPCKPCVKLCRELLREPKEPTPATDTDPRIAAALPLIKKLQEDLAALGQILTTN